MAKFYTPTKLSDNIRETPEGFLLCLGVPICRTGWQVYAGDETPLEPGEDGTVRVYRSWEEVSRPETIASLQGKSITIRHPQDFVAPENWKDLTKGVAQNVRKGEGVDENGEQFLEAELLITEFMAIQLVKNGLREVSVGYEAEYEQTGEGEGKQFNIIGNHIALVEEGRAGSAYAINDHKRKVSMKTTLLEKLTKRFGAKVIDEVMAEEKKESKDEDKKEESKDEESKDAAAYDELVKMVKDLGEKIEGMSKGKDEKEEKPAKDEDDKESKDEDDKEESKDEDESSMEDRLKALETAVAKLLEKKTGDEDEEESEDEEGEEGEESQSEDEDCESSMTGDTKARVEILAPGLKPSKGEDAKQKALMAAFNTKDGRAVIEAITGKKKLVLDSAERINTLFIAASEVLKAQRGTGLEKTKDAKGFDGFDATTETMTAEKMNEINAALWARK